MKLGFGLLMQGNFGEKPLQGIWDVWSSFYKSQRFVGIEVCCF